MDIVEMAKGAYEASFEIADLITRNKNDLFSCQDKQGSIRGSPFSRHTPSTHQDLPRYPSYAHGPGLRYQIPGPTYYIPEDFPLQRSAIPPVRCGFRTSCSEEIATWSAQVSRKRS